MGSYHIFDRYGYGEQTDEKQPTMKWPAAFDPSTMHCLYRILRSFDHMFTYDHARDNESFVFCVRFLYYDAPVRPWFICSRVGSTGYRCISVGWWLKMEPWDSKQRNHSYYYNSYWTISWLDFPCALWWFPSEILWGNCHSWVILQLTMLFVSFYVPWLLSNIRTAVIKTHKWLGRVETFVEWMDAWFCLEYAVWVSFLRR